METKDDKNYWIIMADIIQSSDYEGFVLQDKFKEAVKYVNEKFKKKLSSPLTITLGDEFQGVSNSLKNSILVILCFEEFIIKNNANFALRYVINYGKIDTPINAEIAYGMLGEGLSNARRMLESLKKTDYRFEIETKSKSKSKALNDAFWVMQNIQTKWNSKEDKDLAAMFIQYHDYKIIATKTGVTRSQIWKKEKSLNISSYFAIKNVITYLS
ncbi:hypothetical protein EGI26_16680 [Lacihabitans sp. CCS-44]|uniref:SatD family protein n=1 Tax=Lacihabitans sp. CCS-44 TaxID=2487331 RepID=UPI0020CB6F4A|nr:SatD family protein [Lacihabitans sp. CCS-44]MCP9756802.1 hypothetical protein [Lacihabitans sp. CCS-44]